MKKVLFAVAAAAALVFSSCGPSAPKTADSMFIYSGWALYSQKEDGSMEGAAKVETGDLVKVYVDAKGEYKTIKAPLVLSNGKTEEFDFYQVQYDDKDYWTRSCFFAGKDNVSAGCALTSLNTYSSDNVLSLISGKNSKIKAGESVVVINDECAEGFTHLKSFNWEPFGGDIYVNEAVTVDPKCIDAVKTLNKFSKDTKKEVFEEIIVNLIKKYDFEENEEMEMYFFAWATVNDSIIDHIEGVK